MRNRRGARRSRGETLVETLAAILIVTLSSIVLVTAAVTAARINRGAAQRDAALEAEIRTAEEQAAGTAGVVGVEEDGSKKGTYSVFYYGGDGTLASYAYEGGGEG